MISAINLITLALAAQAKSTSSYYTTIIYLAIFIGIFYFLLIYPQQRKAKAHRQLVSDLKKGDKVVTMGGVIGKIKSIDDEKVVLEIDKNVSIKVLRGAVTQKIEGKETKESEEKEEKSIKVKTKKQ